MNIMNSRLAIQNAIIILVMSMSSINSSKDCSFSSMDSDVDLRDCGKREIRSSEISNLKKVIVLRLQNNILTTLDPYTFWNLKTLRTLLLGNNPGLVVPEKGLFLCNDFVNLVDLSDNELGALRPSSFACMPKLKVLVLDGNPGCKESQRLTITENATYETRCDNKTFSVSIMPSLIDQSTPSISDQSTPNLSTGRQNAEFPTPPSTSTYSSMETVSYTSAKKSVINPTKDTTTRTPLEPSTTTSANEEGGSYSISVVVWCIVGLMIVLMIIVICNWYFGDPCGLHTLFYYFRDRLRTVGLCRSRDPSPTSTKNISIPIEPNNVETDSLSRDLTSLLSNVEKQ